VAVASQLWLWRRSGGAPRELEQRRRLQRWHALEHLALLVALIAGAAVMLERGFRLGYPRWLALKLGLVAFLLIPLEGIHAYAVHVWIARGLRQTKQPPFSRDLARGIGVEEMVRTLALTLLSVALPLIFWLSLAKPF